MCRCWGVCGAGLHVCACVWVLVCDVAHFNQLYCQHHQTVQELTNIYLFLSFQPGGGGWGVPPNISLLLNCEFSHGDASTW